MKLTLYQQKKVFGWLFVLPVVLGTLIFNVFPIIPSFVFSLTDWTGLSSASWVGLQNYIDLVHDEYFKLAVQKTVIYMLGTVSLGIIAGMGLALLINRSLKGITFFRTTYFLPAVTSIIALGIVWRWILNAHYGVVNATLRYLLGITGPRWLGEPFLAMLSVIVVSVWWRMGYNMILFLAGLQGIPEVFYEAAEIDGATRSQKFLHITWPLLTPITFFVLIMSVIGGFRAFNIVYILTEGGPGYATSLYVYRLWEEAFHYFKMGYASAMAWTLFVVIALITVFQWKMAKRWVFYR